jgi:integrase
MTATSEFMIQLVRRFQDEKRLADSTAHDYVRTLFTLNGRKPFRTLAFLTDLDDITYKLKQYAESTSQAIVGAIVSTLSLFPTNKRYTKALNHYRELLKEKTKELKEETAKSEMTPKQKDNWFEWEEVMAKHKELADSVEKLKKPVTGPDWDKLLRYVVLSLYTMIAPRRNKDFQEMLVVNKLVPSLPKDKNYYAIKEGKFLFNTYKTAKTYGSQEITVPEDLKKVLDTYIALHPNRKDKRKAPNFPLLVKDDGTALNASNGITRTLNKIFGRKVGASMLRHIWLTGKYSKTVEDMGEDAKAMAHSTAVQRTYIKKKGGSAAAGEEAPTNEIVEPDSESDEE